MRFVQFLFFKHALKRTRQEVGKKKASHKKTEVSR